MSRQGLERNVHVWNPRVQPAEIVAGFFQHQQHPITVSNFYKWLNTVLILDTPWRLFPADASGRWDHDGRRPLHVDSPDTLAPGNYVILTPDGQPMDVMLTPERHRPRILSLNVTGTPRVMAFVERVRQRDRRCCVTGEMVEGNFFAPYIAGHIFPLAHRDVWNQIHMAQYIEDDYPHQGESQINSIQNGLLLRADVHNIFDAYMIGINPDDGYRVFDFRPSGRFHGLVMYINTAVEPKYRPCDELLRDQFRQCILANVRGAGMQDDDWPDGETEHDLSHFGHWGRQLGEGQPSRLELEVRSRLYGQSGG